MRRKCAAAARPTNEQPTGRKPGAGTGRTGHADGLPGSPLHTRRRALPLYEALKEYDEAHPEIELEFVSPVGGASDPAKREEEIHQLNTEIITGGGPDVFIMGTFRYTDSNLFPDVAKAMGNHAFLPLNAYAQAAGFQRDDYIQPALEAGQREGEQYILPLSISVPLFVGGKDAVEKSGFDAEAAAANQTAFLMNYPAP